MKQSFRGLAARSSLPRTLLTGLIMTVIEVGLFRLLGWGAVTLEMALIHARMDLVFILALAGLHAVFCLRGLLGAKSDLPYGRLGLSRRQMLALLAEQNAVCYFLLWAWQTLVALALAAWWCHAHPAAVGPQTMFVTAYRVSFLHALLPLGDVWLWVRNVALCLSLGVCSAYAALSRKTVGPLIVGVIAAIFWPMAMAMATLAIIEIAVLLAAAAFCWMDGKDEPDDAEA